MRQAIARARRLELAAAHSSEQADMLAEIFQVVLDGVAVVTEPDKVVTLKGQDDS